VRPASYAARQDNAPDRGSSAGGCSSVHATQRACLHDIWAVIKTTGWIYLALLAAYAIYHTIRTPWKLDKDRAGALANATTSRDELAKKLKEIEDARPNIVLRDPGAEHIQSTPMNVQFGGALILSFAKVRFVNKPSTPAQRVEAKKVMAKVKFYDVNGSLVLEMDGRWNDSDQPSTVPPGKSRNSLLPIDFAIDQEHNLDLAYWDQNSKGFVAWNNDSCDYPLGKKPQHVLKGQCFKVEIRLVSPEVDRTFSFQMATDEFGPTIRRM
jgi:hypothetical protein